MRSTISLKRISGLSLSIILTAANLWPEPSVAQSNCSALFSPQLLVSWQQPKAVSSRAKFLSASNFYDRVYAHYDGKIRAELIQQLHSIDGELDVDRTLFALIEDPRSKRTIGTFRIFDSANKPWDPNAQTTEASDYTKLPYERLNEWRHMHFAFRGSMEEAAKLPPAEMVAYIRKGWEPLLNYEIGQRLLRWIRTQNLFHIFEVGKLSLHGTPKQMAQARHLIEDYWQENVLEKFPTGLFIAHVASKAHARLYKQLWGFEVAHEYDVVGSSDREYILWAPGWLISQHIAKNHGKHFSQLGVPPADLKNAWQPNVLRDVFRKLNDLP